MLFFTKLSSHIIRLQLNLIKGCLRRTYSLILYSLFAFLLIHSRYFLDNLTIICIVFIDLFSPAKFYDKPPPSIKTSTEIAIAYTGICHRDNASVIHNPTDDVAISMIWGLSIDKSIRQIGDRLEIFSERG